MKEDFIKFLRQEFPEGQLVSGGKEFQCRCRLCGDSKVNPYKMRFYIALDDPSGIILYNCFNCGAGGVLTPKILSMISSAPANILIGLADNNRNKARTFKMVESVVYHLQQEPVADNKLNRAKLDYFNRRLGLNLTYQDLIANKIVFSLNSLININNFKYTMNPSIIQELDTFYIGAISVSNTMVYLRDVSDGGSSLNKHFKYTLARISGANHYYAIPSTVNMEKPVRINIAEGMFDINSIFFNLRGCNRENEMYFSCGSQSYLTCIKRILTDYGLINCEFHLYFDNDVDISVLRRIHKICSPINIPIIQHRNRFPRQKDFGVPRGLINDVSCPIEKVIR